MSKKLLWVLLFLLPLCVNAQDSLAVAETPVAESESAPQKKFGYLSYSAVILELPEYLRSQEKLSALQKKYDEELARSEKEFNLKFVEFLDGQKEFPENILLKRQKELQDLMEKSLQFKNEVKALLEQARQDLSDPVIEKLNGIISQIGQEFGLEYVLNTDNNACPYIDKNVGLDITNLVRERCNQAQ